MFPMETASHLKLHLDGYGIFSPLIGVGSVYTNPLMLSSSFLEASAAAQLAPLNNERVLRYEQQEHASEQILMAGESMTNSHKYLLLECVRRGESEQALKTFEDIFRAMAQYASSLLMLRYFVTGIINTLLVCVSNDLEIPGHEVEKLLHFNSSRELHDNMTGFLNDICERMHKRNAQKAVEMKSQVVAYIQSHYKRYDISVQTVATTFGIQRQQVNEILKEDIGQAFTQYIALLRLNEFKRLLVETEETVQRLVGEIGYMDVPNFLRKFKQTEGITPSQYRYLHRI